MSEKRRYGRIWLGGIHHYPDTLGYAPEGPIRAAVRACLMILARRIEQIDQESEGFAALELVFEEFDELMKRMGESLNIDMHQDFLQCLALARAIMNKFQIDPLYADIEFSDNAEHNIEKIIQRFDDWKKLIRGRFSTKNYDDYLEKFEAQFGTGFFYELSDDDIYEIQERINKLRSLISETKVLDEDHRRRLLRRLEILQAELHKRVSDFDHYYGMAVETYVLLKKYGEGMSQILNEFKGILRIVFRSHSEKEQLPAGEELPLLPTDSNNNDS